MSPTASELSYREIGAAGLDEIQSQWEQLKAHHVALSPQFGSAMSLRTFAARKAELLAKAESGKLRVEIACAGPTGPCVAYCISTVSAEGAGEVDSLVVEDSFRGQGIGTELMRRALSWLDTMQVTAKVVTVLAENAAALAFYHRFGFHPRTVLLQEIRNENTAEP